MKNNTILKKMNNVRHNSSYFVNFFTPKSIFCTKKTILLFTIIYHVIILVMDIYRSHYSAATAWNVPNLENVVGKKYINKRLSSGLIDITVSERRARYKRSGYIIHSCSLALPRNAIVKRNGKYIASPELVFLQLANELDIQRLILLGILMCSHKAGRPNEAITTKRRIEILLSKTKGHQGHSKAVRALRHIEDGAASINEALAFMIITLPHSLGGFGLDGATFGEEVLLEEDSQKILRQKRCYLDIYYDDEKLDVEYNSHEYHKHAKSQGKDDKRASALESQGIDVFRITTIQLYERKSFDKLVKNLAKRLERRIQIRTKKFEAAHRNLRSLLPRNS